MKCAIYKFEYVEKVDFYFQILSEIRHLVMDFGYGFELNTTKITGLIVILGSIILTVVFYLIGKNFI
jgi:succinate dehydrogenase / fumarate reductase cytochrome b subunit